MDTEQEFVGFAKIPRLSRDIVITEKIDGTNAQIFITEFPYDVFVGSRSRWIQPNKDGAKNDNFGFAGWVEEHKATLSETLGAGRHYGEWWGKGINRGYGLDHRKFSLFNTSRWSELITDFGLSVVPVLYNGPFSEPCILDSLVLLEQYGSKAAPGFMSPEGVVIFHTAGNLLFKKTIKGDDAPKSS